MKIKVKKLTYYHCAPLKQQGSGLIEVMLALSLCLLSVLALGRLIEVAIQEKQALIHKTTLLLEAKALRFVLPHLSSQDKRRYLNNYAKARGKVRGDFTWHYDIATGKYQLRFNQVIQQQETSLVLCVK